jgi:hypothetical protein
MTRDEVRSLWCERCLLDCHWGYPVSDVSAVFMFEDWNFYDCENYQVSRGDGDLNRYYEGDGRGGGVMVDWRGHAADPFTFVHPAMGLI